MKILIIEDEAALRDSIQKYLEHHGYVCEVAGDFKQGIDKVSSFEYDCVVVDIGLPFGTGLNIVKALKEIESRSGIIIISAKNSLEDKIQELYTKVKEVSLIYPFLTS